MPAGADDSAVGGVPAGAPVEALAAVTGAVIGAAVVAAAGAACGAFRAAYTASAATMPDFIAVCVPLIFGTLRNPAASPTSTPPGKVRRGIDCRPPSFSARAP